jgi:hypothetical protein
MVLKRTLGERAPGGGHGTTAGEEGFVASQSYGLGHSEEVVSRALQGRANCNVRCGIPEQRFANPIAGKL